MPKYIVASEGGKVIRNYKGDFLNISEKRALCYSKTIGQTRAYRKIMNELSEDFKLLIFSNIKKAQEAADMVNQGTSDDFKPELYIKK